MSQRMSTGLCNGLLLTGSLKGLLSTMEVRIYAGTPPATADADCTANTLLCTVKNFNGGSPIAATFDTAVAAPGVLAKTPAETWSGVNAATGTATFYRTVNNADANTLSTTAVRIQGTVGVGGADMNVASVAFVSGATFPVNAYTESFVPS